MPENNGIERTLGRLSTQIESLEARLTRLEKSLAERGRARDREMKELKTTVYGMRDSMIEERGGKKLFYGLLLAAASVGAGLSEAVQRILTVLK